MRLSASCVNVSTARSSSRDRRFADSSRELLDRVHELQARLVDVLRRRAVDHALEPLDEAPLDIGERGLNALDRLALLAVELLAQLALAAVQALRQLVQRLAPLERVRIEVGARSRDRLRRRLLELLTELHERGALHFALRLEALRGSRHAVLRLLDEAPLLCRQPLELVEERRLRALEILAPFRQALLDASLNLVQRVAQLDRRRPLAFGDQHAALFRDAAFLLAEERERFGACAGENLLELGRALLRSLLDNRVQPRLRLLQLGVDAVRVDDAAVHAERRGGGESGDGHPCRGDRDLRLEVQREEDPGADGARAGDAREPHDLASREAVEPRARERSGCEEDPERERDAHDVHRVHGVHRRGYTCTRSKAAPSATAAAASRRSAVSSSARTVPFSRRAARTGVESTRCAYERRAA